MIGSALQLERTYVRGTAESPTLWAFAGPEARLDARGILWAWGREEPSDASCLEGVRIRWREQRRGTGRAPPLRVLEERLITALTRVLAGRSDVALALSGGLDSALVLAGIRRAGLAMPHAVTWRTGDPACDEVHAAEAIGAAFGVEVEIMNGDPSAYVEGLPAAIEACEAPLYNLHPVSRFLLMTRLRRRGFGLLLSGDGADAVFSDRPSHLLQPIVTSLARRARIEMFSPFCDPDLIEVAEPAVADLEKRVLRALALELGVPRPVVDAPKRPRLAPRIDLTVHEDWPRARALCEQLGILETPRDRPNAECLTTLVLFDRALEARR